jgi:hypothetical protein
VTRVASTRQGLTPEPLEQAARALGVGVDVLRSGGDAAGSAARAAWAQLDEPARAVLGTLVARGGSAEHLVVRDGAKALLEAQGTGSAAAAADADRALMDLWESGLCSRDRASRVFYVVPEAWRALIDVAREHRIAQLPEVDPPEPWPDDHLLACALNLLTHEPLKVTRQRALFKRDIEVLATRLGPLLPQKDRMAGARAVIEALERLELLQQGETLAPDRSRALAWASATPAERFASGRATEGTAPLVLRQMLALAPARAWSVGELALACSEARDASLRHPPHEAARGGPSEAEVEEGVAALRVTGLVGLVPGGRLALTRAGRSFPEPPEARGMPGFHVGHDLSVLVPRGMPARLHLGLADVALLESADNAARYRLDRGAVLAALDRGVTPAALESFLAAHARPALPMPVRDDLRRWTERFGEITSHQGITVACRVASRHAEFAAVVTATGLSATQLAPGIVVVATGHHAALVRALAEAGFTPRAAVLDPAAPAMRSAVPAASGDDAVARLAEDLVGLPAWGVGPRATGAFRAAPAPRLLAQSIKEKYRREFGSATLLALDTLGADELLALEDRGQVRQFLSAAASGEPDKALAPALEEYAGDELRAVSPVRARRLLEAAAAAGLRCQVSYLERPGRTTKLIVDPIEIAADAAGTWLRARVPGQQAERMLACERVHALRILRGKD